MAKKTKNWLVITLAILPFFHLIYAFFSNDLTANPIRTITIRTGWYALISLFLTLIISPFNNAIKSKTQVNLRKILGLMTFFYAFLHFLNFVWYDFNLNLGLILNELTTKPFIILGLLALLGLLLLFIISFEPLKTKLGKAWFPLQKSVYLYAALILTHFYLAKKGDKSLPLLFTGLFLILLIFRIPSIRNLFVKQKNL